jgi:hypothetical protein
VQSRWLLQRSPLLIPLVIVSVGFWPGHMNADTLIQIDQASGGTPITDHYATILIWAWSLVWPLGIHPGAILLVQTLAFLVGSYLVLRAAFTPLWSAWIAALVSLWPAVFGNLGLLGRDEWFLSLLLLSFGFVIWAARRPEQRGLALALAGASVFLCLAARQNAAAAAVVPVIAAASLLLGPRLRDSRRVFRLGLPVVTGVLATVVIIGVQVGSIRLAGTASVHPEQFTYIYDLANLSRREDRSLFPHSVYPSQDVGTIDATSSLDTLIPLVAGPNPPLHAPFSANLVADLREAWIDAVTDDPLEYLDTRWDAWLRQIGVTRPAAVIYHPGIDPNSFGYEVALDGPNDVVTGYQELFADDELDGGVLHRVWIYLLLAAVSAAVLLRRGGAPAIVGGLGVAAWTYQAGIFFGAMGTQYRLEFPAVTLALLSTIVAGAVLVCERRAAASNPRPPNDC